MSALSQAPPDDSVFRLKNILVPTDFSTESNKALRYGIAFAQKFDAVLSLIHVVEPPPVFGGFESIPIVVEDAEVQKNADQNLVALAKKNVPLGVAVSPLAVRGVPFEEIVSTARARKIDLIITSTHGHTGLKRVLFGSTAERIVQRAPCPVLAVREREHEFLTGATKSENGGIRLARILVPTDFSDCSRKALHYATAFAKIFRAEIFLLHVLDMPLAAGEAGMAVEMAAYQKSIHAAADKGMIAFLKDHPEPPPAEKEIRAGVPYREIIQTADNQRIDLIVMGTHGRTGLGHFLLGSVTERVVRHARSPVLVVREREHEFIEPVRAPTGATSRHP
jgi:nucleotide-binding universal stress UspA family protein